jgi:hypothetical protein
MFALAPFFKFLAQARTCDRNVIGYCSAKIRYRSAQKALYFRQHGRESAGCGGLSQLSAWIDAKNRKRTQTKIVH